MTKCIADIMAPWVFLNGEDYPDRHDWHWHRYHRDHEDWMSIWVDHEPWDEWIVEVYPVEEGSTDVSRTGHETREEATQRIADLMEKYD